ncbi:hypothetical protein V8E54_003207 [Elaphomyces granulatus]
MFPPFPHLLFMNLFGLHIHFRQKEPGVGLGGRSFFILFYFLEFLYCGGCWCLCF